MAPLVTLHEIKDPNHKNRFILKLCMCKQTPASTHETFPIVTSAVAANEGHKPLDIKDYAAWLI